ncbi:Mitochondrial arginine transporter BAC1 [Linum perenne]
MEQANPAYKEYLAGLLAGVSTVIIGHPFDTVKVKLQKHNTEAHGVKYRNGLDCSARILQTEGVKGLYRGATSSFVGVAVESSLLFGIYSRTKQSLQKGVQTDKPQPQVIIPSAAYGGSIISFILCPSELVKAGLSFEIEILQCRMQVQGAGSLVPKIDRYSSSLDCAIQTMKHDGVTGLFRGGLTTFMREAVGNAAFFSVYEYVRYYMHRHLKGEDRSYLMDMGIGIVTGGLGGVAFWSVVLPLDVAKTIIQTSPNNSTRNPFKVLNSIYKSNGVKGCYTGLGPTIVRAFPANAAAIVTWELAMKMLGIERN